MLLRPLSTKWVVTVRNWQRIRCRDLDEYYSLGICDECDDGISSRAAQTIGAHDLAAHLEKMSDPYEEEEW